MGILLDRGERVGCDMDRIEPPTMTLQGYPPMFQFLCPHCGKKCMAPADAAGKPVRRPRRGFVPLGLLGFVVCLAGFVVCLAALIWMPLHEGIGGAGKARMALHERIGGAGKARLPLHERIGGAGKARLPLHERIGGAGKARLPSLQEDEKQLVVDWLRENLNDPTELEIVHWGVPRFVRVGVNRRRSVLGADGKEAEQVDEIGYEPGIIIHVQFIFKDASGARKLCDGELLIQGGEITVFV
jgi:hypothetical protein